MTSPDREDGRENPSGVSRGQADHYCKILEKKVGEKQRKSEGNKRKTLRDFGIIR